MDAQEIGSEFPTLTSLTSYSQISTDVIKLFRKHFPLDMLKKIVRIYLLNEHVPNGVERDIFNFEYPYIAMCVLPFFLAFVLPIVGIRYFCKSKKRCSLGETEVLQKKSSRRFFLASFVLTSGVLLSISGIAVLLSLRQLMRGLDTISSSKDDVVGSVRFLNTTRGVLNERLGRRFDHQVAHVDEILKKFRENILHNTSANIDLVLQKYQKIGEATKEVVESIRNIDRKRLEIQWQVEKSGKSFHDIIDQKGLTRNEWNKTLRSYCKEQKSSQGKECIFKMDFNLTNALGAELINNVLDYISKHIQKEDIPRIVEQSRNATGIVLGNIKNVTSNLSTSVTARHIEHRDLYLRRVNHGIKVAISAIERLERMHRSGFLPNLKVGIRVMLRTFSFFIFVLCMLVLLGLGLGQLAANHIALCGSHEESTAMRMARYKCFMF